MSDKKIENIDKKTKTIDFQRVVKVADRIDLQAVRLIQSDCLLRATGLRGPYELALDQSVEVRVDSDRKSMAVIPSFKVDAFVKDVKKEEPDFKISASFVLNYKIENSEGLSDEDFQAFGDVNGIFNAWPYWREFVQNTTVRMGLPPLTIPVFRFPSSKVTQKKKIESAEVSVEEAPKTKIVKKRKVSKK